MTLVSLVIALLFSWTEGQAAPRVVVLHSQPQATGWTDNLDRGIRAVLGSGTEVVSVCLGSSRDDDDHFDARFRSLADEWGDERPEVVVADGGVAFAFMRKYREDLFGGVPVIYAGMSRPEPEYLRQCGECSGIPLAYDVEGTLEVIFATRPATTVVVGIMDGRPESLELRRRAEAAMEPYLDRAQLMFPGHEPGDDAGLDLVSLADVAASVPGSGAVLFLGFAEDREGNPVSEGEVVRLLVESGRAPVFALSDEWLDARVLGGSMVSPEAHGRAVARMIISHRQGEPVAEMLVESPPAGRVVNPQASAAYDDPQGMAAGAAAAGRGLDDPGPETVREGAGQRVPLSYLMGGGGIAVLLVLGLVLVGIRRSAARKGR